MPVKLYVGNLPFSATEEELKTLFTNAGNVVSVAIIKDRYSGESKGFGFIEMETQAEAQKAMSSYNGYAMSNRELKVNLAKPREERGGLGNGYNRGRNDRGGRGRF
jgi:RNA recognition motif-containing protein